MRNVSRRFLKSTSGSFVPIFAISLVPLVLAVGMSVDYTSAVSDKANMQNALDAAALSLTTMDRTATDAQRLQKLQDTFTANGGQGTASLDSVVFDADGTLHVSASASYAMPTNFMNLAMIKTVPIDVATAVNKKPTLVNATFKIDKASGWWNKTITLYGRPPTSSTYTALMQISYTYNGGGDAKGYGTTTVATPDSKGGFTKIQQQQTCTTNPSSNYGGKKKPPIPSGAIIDNVNNKVTVCSYNSAYGSTGASIDVSQMIDLYLQMDVPSGNPNKLKSNDPTTSNRLYLDGTEVATGQTVDIFTAVPCGQTSYQAWEDGGNAVPAPVANADFFYYVTGKCDYSQRVSETRLTQ